MQQFLHNVVCILNLAIYGLRFFTFFEIPLQKKRKKSRFLDFQKFSNYDWLGHTLGK